MQSLKGRVALVTGAAVRVGRAISLALARQGCVVFVHYASSHDEALSLTRELISMGVRADNARVDLSVCSQVETLVPSVVERMGRLDFLINNAAIFLEGDLASTSLNNWEGQFAVNLRAPFLLSQAFVSHRPPEGAAIVNILDARTYRPGDDHFAYRLTKSALLAMTEGLAHDLAPAIRVNGVALGAIAPPPGAGDEYLAQLAATRIPLGRAGNPEMVGDNVVHLLSQPFVTGHIIRLDGGEYL